MKINEYQQTLTKSAKIAKIVETKRHQKYVKSS